MKGSLSLGCRLFKLTENLFRHESRKFMLLRTSAIYHRSSEKTTISCQNTAGLQTTTHDLPLKSKQKQCKNFSLSSSILSSFKGLVKFEKQLYPKTSLQRCRSFHTVISSKLISNNSMKLCEKSTQTCRHVDSDGFRVSYSGVRSYSRTAILEHPRSGSNVAAKQNSKKKVNYKGLT